MTFYTSSGTLNFTHLLSGRDDDDDDYYYFLAHWYFIPRGLEISNV